jgi:hypothetical protein
MFFKTNKLEAINAVTEFFQSKTDLHKASDKFAKAFEAKAVVTTSINRVSYAGFVFNNPGKVNTGVWTKPQPSFHRISNLRVKPLKKEFSEEWKAESEKFKKLWDECFPNGNAISKNQIYESVGTDWGNVAFAGFGCFLFDGYVYINTGLSNLEATEILGSEYSEALAKYKEPQQ